MDLMAKEGRSGDKSDEAVTWERPRWGAGEPGYKHYVGH